MSGPHPLVIVVFTGLLAFALYVAAGGGEFFSLADGRFLAQLAPGAGIRVAVPPNELSQLNEALRAKALGIAQREKALEERERSLGEQGFGQRAADRRQFAIIISVLLALVLLNFYLDNRRKNPESKTESRI